MGNRWRLTTLGVCELRAPDGRAVQAASRKGLALMALLAASRDRRASRDRIAALLWEYCDEAQARLNLRKCLSLLRQQAAGLGFDLPIQASGEMLSLEAERLEWDGDALATAPDGGAPAAALQALTAAYRGDFLEGLNLRGAEEFESWARIERQRLRCHYVSAVARLIEASELADAARLEAALRLSALDPLDEALHGQLIRTLAERGQGAAAMTVYRELEQRLLDQLQAAPQPETLALVDAIRGRFGRVTQSPSLQSPALSRQRRRPIPVRERMARWLGRRRRPSVTVATAAVGTMLVGMACVAAAHAVGLGNALLAPAEGRASALHFRSQADAQLYSAAVAHLDSRDPRQVKAAAGLLAQLRAAEPANIDAHLRYAEAMIFLGNARRIPFDTARREASDAVEQALAIDPGSAPAYLAKGLLNQYLLWNYGTDRNRRIALESLGKAASLNPNGKTLAAFGAGLYMADRYPDAVVMLRRALAQDPANLQAQAQLALALETTGHIPQALDQAAFVDRLYPDSGVAKDAATWILVDHGRLASALPLARASARIDNGLIARVWLYTIYVNLGLRQQAGDVLRSFDGGDAAVADIMRLTTDRRYSAAFDRVEQELSRSDDPMWPMAAIELGTLLGRDEVALRYVRRSAPDLLAPSPAIARLDVPMALSAAQAFANTGNAGQARRIAEAALSGPLSTRHYVVPTDYVWRSAAYCLLGQRERALDELEAAYRRGYRLAITRDNFMPLEDYPMFAGLRSEPRFRNVLRQIASANQAEAARLARAPADGAA